MVGDVRSRAAPALAGRARLLAVKLGLLLLARRVDTLSFRRGGMVWHAPVRDRYITPALLADGSYQRAELDGLLRWLRRRGRLDPPYSAIVDVGANIGTSSIPLAQATELAVLAVEPAPDNLALLRRNVDDNGLAGRVVCVNAAVSARGGTIRLALDPENCGGHEVVSHPGPAAAGIAARRAVIEVPARPLDDIVRAHGLCPDQVALVWSDTQGCEQQVIESGTALWSAGVPLYVEVWPAGLRRHGGVADFLGAAERHFGAVILANELRRRGALAAEQPLSALSRAVARLTGELDATDALFLPRPPA